MNRSLSERAEPAVQQLTKALALPELRCGRHALRDHRGWLDDEIDVDYCWHALVMPSFHPWAAVGLIQTVESEFRGRKHSAIIRAAAVIFGNEPGHVGPCASTELQSDPLARVIDAVRLLPRRETISLDGIAYRLCTSDYEIDTTVQIRNPQAPSVRAIEQALFQVAQNIQEQTNNNELAAWLAVWRQYMKR